MLGGPLLGVISLGMFIPQANSLVRYYFNKMKVFLNTRINFLGCNCWISCEYNN